MYRKDDLHLIANINWKELKELLKHFIIMKAFLKFLTWLDLWIPYAKMSWLAVSAREWRHSENIEWDPVYNQATSLNKKLQPFLRCKFEHFNCSSSWCSVYVCISKNNCYIAIAVTTTLPDPSNRPPCGDQLGGSFLMSFST